MSNEHIIGQPTNESNEPPMRMVQKGFLVYQDAEGKWTATPDLATPTETFMNITPEDVIQGCRRVCDSLRDEEKAMTQHKVMMFFAQQMQNQQQNNELIKNLKL